MRMKLEEKNRKRPGPPWYYYITFCPALYDSPGTSYFMRKRKLQLVKPLEPAVLLLAAETLLLEIRTSTFVGFSKHFHPILYWISSQKSFKVDQCLSSHFQMRKPRFHRHDVGQRVKACTPGLCPPVHGFSQENPSCLEAVQSFPLPVTSLPTQAYRLKVKVPQGPRSM